MTAEDLLRGFRLRFQLLLDHAQDAHTKLNVRDCLHLMRVWVTQIDDILGPDPDSDGAATVINPVGDGHRSGKFSP